MSSALLLGSAGVMVVIIAIVAGLKFDQMAKGAVWISAALMGIYLILLYFMIGGKLTEGKRGRMSARPSRRNPEQSCQRL